MPRYDAFQMHARGRRTSQCTPLVSGWLIRLNGLRRGRTVMTLTRVGVVGAGFHGEMHLEAYSASERCELTCICDLNEERARQMAEKYGCDWTTDINELAAAVDGASVATPDLPTWSPPWR